MSFNQYCFEIQGRGQAQMDQEREQEVERAKMDLFRAVMETKRGAQVSPDQRAAIEEAMVRCLSKTSHSVKSYVMVSEMWTE